jgi:hypothetical protein
MPTAIPTSNVTAKQRCHAVAAIVARGVLRYHRRIRRLSRPAKNSSDSSPGGLEVLDDTRLSVSERTRWLT